MGFECFVTDLNVLYICQGGWGSGGTSSDRGGGRIFENNIVRGEWGADGGDRQNNGIFGSVDRTSANVSDVVFRDIRVQGHVCRFFNFEMPGNHRTWSNFTFKDIWFEKPLGCLAGDNRGKEPLDNYLWIDGAIRNFTFENVVIDKQKVRSLNDFSPIKKKNVYNMVFK